MPNVVIPKPTYHRFTNTLSHCTFLSLILPVSHLFSKLHGECKWTILNKVICPSLLLSRLETHPWLSEVKIQFVSANLLIFPIVLFDWLSRWIGLRVRWCFLRVAIGCWRLRYTTNGVLSFRPLCPTALGVSISCVSSFIYTIDVTDAAYENH